MPEWLTAVVLWAGTRFLSSTPTTCICEVAVPRIQPELLELLAKQLDRCGPANLVVPPCAACPAFPADQSLWWLSVGALAGFTLGVALTLLWSLLPCAPPAAVSALAAAAPAAPAVQLAITGASPAALGRRRAAPGSGGPGAAPAAPRDLITLD
jgi:hypothetical protein